MDLQLFHLHHDSPAGRWDLAAYHPQPNDPLADYLQVMWTVEGQTAWSRERILPSGCVDVLVNLGPVQHLLDRDNPRLVTEYRDAWVSGVQQQYLLIESLYKSRLMGIRFLPLGAFRFFGLPMQELSGQVIDLDQVLGASAISELRSRLLEAASVLAQFQILVAWVTERMKSGPDEDYAIRHAYRRLLSGGGDVRIGALAEELGISQRHLIQRFRGQVGVAPKRFARIVRYRSAIERLIKEESVDQASLALDCGYYDQSHFIHDFRAFSGATPTEFLRCKAPNDNDGTASIVVE